MTTIITWLKAHPELLALVFLYLLMVIAKLPPPENPTLRVLWRVFVRLSFLTWDSWGGKPKWLGTIEPPEPEEQEKKK